MKRIIIGALVAVIVAVGAAVAFRRPIADAVYARAVLANAGRDMSNELPDGLHVFVCGSGSPMPEPSRAGPCLGVLAGKRAFLVDVGSGGARRLARMAFPVGRLERVYLTHLHSDHFDGLGEMMIQTWVGGSRKTPLPVAGPEGTAELIEGLNTAYRIDAGFRTAHHGEEIAAPSGRGGVGEVIEAPPPGGVRVLLDDGGLKISVIRVDHAPIDPSFGFRIDYQGRSVVFSGDTKLSPALADAAKGADVLFHEALQPKLLRRLGDANAAAGQPHIARIMTDIEDYHATPEQAAETAATAGVKSLIFYHIVPPLPSRLLEPAFLGDAKRAFAGQMVVSEDGMIVSLPAGGSEVRIRRTR